MSVPQQTVSPSPLDDTLLTESDLLRLYHRKTLRTIRRWIKAGWLPAHVKFGPTRYWRRSAILDHMARLETPSGIAAPKRARRARRATE
jgi:hypothetical protein